MTTPTSEDLVDNAIAAAVRAIEAYNSPNTEYREAIFCILIVNAWELLLKAKILKDNSEKVESIYVQEGNGFKANRNGTPWTLDIFDALRRANPALNIKSNLGSLTDIRDASIHFVADPDIKYVLARLAIAGVVNFKTICSEWFGRSLDVYNFAVLPLSFDYDFRRLSPSGLSAMPDDKAKLIQNILENADSSNDDQYFFMCQVSTRLVSFRKASEEAELTVGITSDDSESTTLIVERKINLNRQYPHSWTEIRDKFKVENKGITSTVLSKIIKTYDLKNNPEYSQLNFRNLKQETEYAKTGIAPSNVSQIYNDEAIVFIRSKAGEFIN